MTWLRKLRLRSNRSSITNNLEYLGEDFLRRVVRAARKESWGRTVIQLAWTAGPVTYLALQGGYHLGYGTNAPSRLFIYFAMYTAIAGLFAILMRFLYQVTRGQELEKGEEALSRCLARLPELILLARNETLLYYDEENRKLLAAKYLLENPDAVTETIKAAVMDISGDPSVAQAAQQIEIYRRNGLYARIEDERSRVSDRLEQIIGNVRPSSQAVADLLVRRFAGRPPNRQSGRTRTEGFIWRVLTAGEEHDVSGMTLNDAEEVFTLTYEMLAGRTIPVFSLRYIGSKEFTDASENLDRSRLVFRRAAYLRNSRLRALAELFAESEPVDIVPAASPVFTTVDLMYSNILQALENLYRALQQHTGHFPFQLRKRYSPAELRDRFMQLHRAMGLHRSLRAANIQMQKRFSALRRSEQKYNEIRAESARQFPLHLLKPDEHRRGIRIVEKQIELRRSGKLRFAREVEKLIHAFDCMHSPQAEDYKKLAVDIAMKSEDELKFSRFETQYAIESSNAPYLSSIELDMTAASKAGVAVSLVQEVQKNIRTPIHRLAHVLVNYHGMPLNQESIDYLVDQYGANPDRLKQMLPDRETGRSDTAEPEGPPASTTGTGFIRRPPQILDISRLDKKYQELIDYAVKRHIL